PFGYDFGDFAGERLVRRVRYSGRRGESLGADPAFWASISHLEARAQKRQYFRKLVPGEASRVATVRRAFELASRGLGIWKIASILNQEGRPSPTSMGWNSTTVGRMLASRTYRGDLVYGLYTQGKFFYMERGDGGGRPVCVERPEEERGKQRRRGMAHAFVKEGAHEGLVSVQIWESVQRARQANRERSARGRTTISSYLLSGLLVCAQCGRKFFGQQNSSTKEHYSYGCSGYRTHGRAFCDSSSVSGMDLDAVILETVGTYMEEALGEVTAEELEPRLIGRLQGHSAAVASTTSTREELEAKIALLRRRLADEPELWDDLVPELKRLKSQAEASVSAPPQAGMVDVEGVVRRVLAEGKSLREILETGDVAPRKAALRRLVAGVTVDAGKGTFEARLVPIESVVSFARSDHPLRRS
ncbi:MAG: recombinase family protein, partial [Planctomycetales bacterium]|nr:recombinase family protein [Planctomycetales bacterium]